MTSKKVSIIIPAFNEAASIGEVIKSIRTIYPDFEIIVVNDASSDNTAEVAEKAGATVLSHPYNIGNGASIKTGMRVASGDFFVTMDGDGQHRPEDIGKLLAEMEIYDMGGGTTPVFWPGIIWQRRGKSLLQQICLLCHQIQSKRPYLWIQSRQRWNGKEVFVSFPQYILISNNLDPVSSKEWQKR